MVLDLSFCTETPCTRPNVFDILTHTKDLAMRTSRTLQFSRPLFFTIVKDNEYVLRN